MAWPITAAAASTVDIEIVQQAGGPIDGSQRWLELLSKLSPQRLRIRSARVGDRPRVEADPRIADHYRITAVLTRQNRLQVPGRSFRFGDLTGIKEWIATLDAVPSEDDRSPSAAFGLSAEQLVELSDRLSVPVSAETVDRPSSDVVRKILEGLSVPSAMDATAQRRLRQAAPVQDRLQGISSGTALAAVLRPLGLAVVPRRNAAGQFSLRIQSARGEPEVWPVGWPAEEPAGVALPVLMEKLPVEIVEMPVTKVLAALQPRIGVPVLIDHRALNLRDIRLDEIKVSFASKRTYYKRVLDRVLFQARLEMHVHVDEADRPFLWIQPIR